MEPRQYTDEIYAALDGGQSIADQVERDIFRDRWQFAITVPRDTTLAEAQRLADLYNCPVLVEDKI